MYGILTYMYHKNQPFMDQLIYQSHGSYGDGKCGRDRLCNVDMFEWLISDRRG